MPVAVLASLSEQCVSAPPTQTAYRRDIDGLRAFSILSVILFHAFPRLLPGGFIGVDVFFVISGFLISSLIFNSLNAGAFRYAAFYSRRIKRIFPALLVVLIASLAAGWLFLFEDEWRQLGKHVFAGAAFVSNIILMRDGGYFQSSLRPLLHLWSLGIEEQFYIVWPLMLVIAWKWRRATLPSLLLVLFVSFGLNLWLIPRRPVFVFYFPGTRFWELTLGALQAYLVMFSAKTPVVRWMRSNPWMPSIVSAAGLSLLIASLVLISEEKAFPGAWALLPTLGASLMIAAGPQAWINRAVLSSRPMVFIGLISYPLYLWHWPVLFFTRLLSPASTAIPAAVAALGAAGVLAWLTYRLVERPLRHHRSSVAVPCLLAVSVGVIGLVGLLPRSHRWQPRLAKAAGVAAAINDWDYPFGQNFGKASNFRSGRLNGLQSGEVLFIGDSHAEQYYSRVKALMNMHSGHLPTSVFLTSAGCPPLPSLNRTLPGYTCDKFFDYAMAQARDSRVTTVVFSAFWEIYFSDRQGHLATSVYRTAQAQQTGTDLADLEFSEFGASIRSLTGRGKRVFVILSNPAGNSYDPRRMISRLTGKPITANREVSVETFAPSRSLSSRLGLVAAQSGATVIDPFEYLCQGSVCRTTGENGAPLYKDGHHLRSSFAAQAATYIDQVFRPAPHDY